MKKTKRILAVVLTTMLLITGLLSSFNVSAAAATYVCDLGLDKIENGQFKFMAYDATNKQFVDLEPDSRQTWSPDWPGHFVPDTGVYTLMKSEKVADGACIDMMCDLNSNWGSAVIFTAPLAGVYNLETILWKWSGPDSNEKCFYVDITIAKGDGTVLYEKKSIGAKEEIVVEENDIALAAGETLYILITPNSASTKTNSSNVALIDFEVTAVSQQPADTTDPGTTNPGTTNPDTNDSVLAYIAVAVVALFGIACVSKKKH